jgi:hypothetical protein
MEAICNAGPSFGDGRPHWCDVTVTTVTVPMIWLARYEELPTSLAAPALSCHQMSPSPP